MKRPIYVYYVYALHSPSGTSDYQITLNKKLQKLIIRQFDWVEARASLKNFEKQRPVTSRLQEALIPCTYMVENMKD